MKTQADINRITRTRELPESGLTGVVMSEFKHKGNRPDRAADLMPERVFAEEWKKENERQSAINFGYIALELILNCKPLTQGPPNWQPPIDQITQRDATVAASVIQWLGTNCGEAFLFRCEHRITRERKREQIAFNQRYNTIPFAQRTNTPKAHNL